MPATVVRLRTVSLPARSADRPGLYPLAARRAEPLPCYHNSRSLFWYISRVVHDLYTKIGIDQGISPFVFPSLSPPSAYFVRDHRLGVTRSPGRRRDRLKARPRYPVRALRSRAVETDVELLSRLRDGDEEAFAMLVANYQQPMLRLARSVVPSRAVAEEAVQDTWMGVVRGIHRFEGRSSLKTWLFRIVVNRARSAGSREHPNAPLDALHTVDPARFDLQGHWADPLERWTDESDNRLDAAVWLPVLTAALDDLPPRQRQVVILRDVDGLSSEEACGVLSISVGNQRILLHRGRARLRRILENEMRRD